MLFFDFEVFRYDWLVVIIDMTSQSITVIVNDSEALIEFYDSHKKDIWIGFNNKHYDNWILKAILCDFDAWTMNDFIINKGRRGWEFSKLFRKIPLISYDVFQPKIDRGLKFFEASLGHRIKETSVPFDIRRKLTKEELDMEVEYCTNDVVELIETFMIRKNEFDSQLGLIKMFPDILSIYDLSLTKAQISAKILECEYTKRDDEFNLYVLPCIKLNKYKQASEWFLQFRPDSDFYFTADEVYDSQLIMEISGIEHTLAWGGIHAGREQFDSRKDKRKRQYWHVDVASFYPRLMIFHNLLTRSSKRPEKFRQIYERRIELKHAGKKKEQAPLKIVINGTYGISKAETSKAYDPLQANLICMNGQLMLIQLIEMLEKIDGFELIQSNTDGLIVSLPDTDEAFEQMDDICYEWETQCNMELEFDEISWIVQKDVNNYIFQFSNGKYERKGAYVKELDELSQDLPIVTKAVFDAIVDGIPVEETIMNCDDMKQFQMIRKISSKYQYILHGGYWTVERRKNPKTGRMKNYNVFVGKRQKLNEKCVRIYASLDKNDGGVWKKKNDDSISKMEGTPEHSFLINDDVTDMKCPSKLDKMWYINEAKERLEAFGKLGD